MTKPTAQDLHDESLDHGDPVLGQACPRCRRLDTIVYSGNYWCTRCSWVMADSNRPKRIIAAYLIQRRDEALAAGDAETVAHMDFYLKDYDGVVL